MTRKTVIFAIILTMVAFGCSKPNPDNPGGPSTPENPENPISIKLKGSWKISNTQTEGLPDFLIFQDGSKGVVYDSNDIKDWFGLKLLEPINFAYSIKDNNAVTMKLMTGTNINAYFDTNYQGDPIINLSDGNLYYYKTSDSTELPYTDKKDEPFVKVIKVIDCTDNTITVQCQVINSRILDMTNVSVGACAFFAGNDPLTAAYHQGANYKKIKEVGTNLFECVIDGVKSETSYDIYAFATDGKNNSYGTTPVSCTTKAFPSRGDALVTKAGNAVDLGLPSGLLWADRNIGSATMASNGAYFVWGQTKELRNNIVDYDNDSDNKLREKGIIDSNGHLTAQFDAATQLWGSGWRLPTKDEINELISNCSWSLMEDKTEGIYGLMAQSKKNGEWIYFPKAGYYDSSSKKVKDTIEGYYLTSDVYSSGSGWDASYGFKYLYFNSTTINWYNYESRNVAFSVRPVYKK